MKRLLMITYCVLACALLVHAKTYVVSIGIADYPGTKSDLRLSDDDAVTIKRLYEKNEKAEVEVLTNQSATLKNVVFALQNLFAKATSDDTIVLFFSGHGVPGGFICYDGLLKYETIVKAMDNSDAGCKMVFADACFAGKARKDNGGFQHSSANIMFFLSSRTAEKSMEKRNWRNSLFTAYLERGLRGGADVNRDRQITAKELFDFVSKGVAKKSIGTQHPVMWGKLNNNMTIMSW
jgi:uncharacterized caspase-like protein